MSKETDIVEEAKKRWQKANDHYSKTRKLAVEDTKFVMGDSDNGWQWPDEIRKGRETDKRVCLTVNMTAQHCNQIINNIRMNRPAAKVSPADDYADKKTAEILGGVIRQIQAASNADEAHDTAAEHGVYGGEGYWRIVTEYESDKSFNQVLRVVACPNPNNVFIDPDAKKADRSDAKWGMIFEDFPKETIKREHGIDASDFVDIDGEWVKEDCVRVAEYFYCDTVEKTLYLFADGSTAFKDEVEEGTPFLKERVVSVDSWKWCKLIGGHDKPVDEREWLGKYLPIITVVGKELNVNGEKVIKGVVRDLKDPARMVNFAYSETVQTLALQNKIPYLIAAEAVEGHEDDWQDANTDNKAYLVWNALDDDGNALPKPERQPPAVMPAAQVQLLQLSTEQMRAASGQQNANFGIKSEASSGVGIQRLKAQGEIATFHFPDNLARALRYEAKVLIDLIQKYYDSKRIVRILGLDGKQEQATLDPEMEQPYAEMEGEEEVEKIFNPSVGEYDVVIDTGPSYQTQRQEGAANLNELAARNPQIMQVAGDIVMRAQDFPMADQLAERLAKTLPPELQDAKPGQNQPDPQTMAAMQQMQGQLQALDEAVQGMTTELEKAEEEKRTLQFKLEKSEIDIKTLKAVDQIEDAQRELETLMQSQQVAQQAAIDPQAITGSLAEALAPVFESVAAALQQQAEQQAITQEQLVAAIEGNSAATQESVNGMVQAILSERAQPRTVRLSSGKIIEINPAQMAQ